MKKASRRFPQLQGWWGTLVFFVLGLVIYFFVPGFTFSGVICFGIMAVLLCYQLLRLLSRRHRKGARILQILFTVCLAVLTTAAAVTGAVILKAGAGHKDAQCSYVIVLGAGVNGNVPSQTLRERIDAAYRYLTEHPDAVCVVSGGQGSGENISEAQCMFDALTARGIEADRVWMEDQATNTRENLAFSLDLIESHTGSRPTQIGLVSSEYHLYRAGLFAREQGVTALGIPGKTQWLALRMNYFLREIAAVWYYTVFG